MNVDFLVIAITKYGEPSPIRVELSPDTKSAKNKQILGDNPKGRIEVNITDETTAAFFKAGQKYSISFQAIQAS